MRTARLPFAVPALVVIVVLSAVTGPSATAARVAVAGPPPLELVATASAVTVERPQGQFQVELGLGTVMVAGRSAFEVRVERRSYHDPIVATQVIRDPGRIRMRTLDDEVVRDFGGFTDFFHLRLTDIAGNTVLDLDQDFCPGGHPVRLRSHGPEASPYPPSCPTNPFTLGTVWGVQAGWGTPTGGLYQRVDTRGVPDGDYIARLWVTKPYRDVFEIPANTITVQVTLKTVPPRPPLTEPPVTPDRPEPTGPATVPARSRPDLVALPAWAVDIQGDNARTPEVENERLTFAANVWNAGPSPLVVDGFRRAGEAVMDSYQYFYDSTGDQVGHAPVGSMEWDPRAAHRHWHFRDFAGYRLLDSGGHEVVRSQKEAFCVANTDAIDLFVENAAWQPDHTDLHTSCGREDAQTVREVLATGHGDTYANSAPGRALDIHGLPNGTYYIQVVANPDHKLYETDLGNNVSLRRVVLGGTPGARTVRVPPYESIDTDPAG